MNRALKIVGALAVIAVGVTAAWTLRRRRKPEVPAEPAMALPRCIFCNEESGSEEHFWPAWVHIYPQYESLGIAEVQPPPSISDAKLVQIYPRKREFKKFDWPTTPFTNGGPNGIGYLMYRWKKDGKQVSTVTKNGVIE